MLQLLLKKLKSPDKDFSFLLKKGAFAFVYRIAGMLTQYLFVFLVARWYGAKEQGSFTLYFTILQLFAILAQMGMDNRLTRVIAAHHADDNRNIIKSEYLQTLKITFISAVLWSILCYLMAPWIADSVLHKPQLEERIRLIAFGLTPFILTGLNGSAFRGFKNMAGYLLFRAINFALAALLLLIIYEVSYQAGSVESYTVSAFVICLLSFAYWYRYSKIAAATLTTLHQIRTLISDSFPMMLTGSVFFILGWTDNLMLGIFRTEEEVGMYDVAFKLATLSALLLLAINAIQAPVFAELFKKHEMKKLQQFVMNSTRILFFVSLPVTIVLCIFPKTMLGFFGPAFVAAWPALIILSIGNFVNSITGSIGILLQMTGHQKEYNRIIMISAGLSILLNIILIPRIGISGAAISSAIAKILQNLASVAYARKKLGILSIYIPGMSGLNSYKTNNTTE